MNGGHSDALRTLRMGAGISIVEGIAGLVAVALAIIGLANVAPWVLASVAAIALGAAFVFESGAMAARFSALESEAQEESVSWLKWSTAGAEFLMGFAGIALGILALLGIDPAALVPVAIIVYGTALMVDSGIRMRLRKLETKHLDWRSFAFAAPQVFVGLGSITLSILALVGVAPLALILVGLLSVGTAVLITGSLVTGRSISLYRRSE